MSVAPAAAGLRSGGPVKIDPAVLRREMLVRGLGQRQLAAAAALSEGTVSKVLAFGTTSPATLAALVRTLAANPELPFARELLGDETAAETHASTAITEELGVASAALPNQG
ncbi:MAG: hypothetical protein ACRENY_10085 [Candidatus Dormibacteria bacterium]